MADAARAILSREAAEATGQCFVDEDVLRAAGVTDFSPHRYGNASEEDLQTDLFLPRSLDA
ncbi:MAG TPA: hypothetical protein VMU94_10880 [Streptosporangiaceae bacterium]|nr:hypothetical protein [Streptosporangiaceae bacterium]